MPIIAIFLAKKEKVFQFLARLLPSWLSPNILSTSRAVFIVPIYFLFRNEQLTWVVILFMLGLITDILDGVYARTSNKITTIGKLLDPAADKILFIGLFLLIAPHRLTQTLIVTLISLEMVLVLLATVIGPLVARLWHRPLPLGANLAGKIKMSLEGIATILLLIGRHNHTLINISEGILWLAAGCALMSIILHLKQAKSPQASTGQ
jgi:CDP-diacylglycerol--glycerol-3-phosphate 3-phosphatidyltransferase